MSLDNKSEAQENANMADNQVAFRRYNSRLKKLTDELRKNAIERGEAPPTLQKNVVYQFYCECSNEDCIERIPLSYGEYQKAHERDDTFIILNGHEVFDIEEVIKKTPEYCVVKKFETPKQSNVTLHETALSN